MVTVVGLGFVGLTTALGFAEYGHKVYGIEADSNRLAMIREGRIPFEEPGLGDALTRHLGKNFIPTSEWETAIPNSDCVYFCVGTPCNDDGEADLTALQAAIKQALDAVQDQKFRVFVTKSTTPPRTAQDGIVPFIRDQGFDVPGRIGVASNPEFLREGHCWEDFMGADRIVLGVEDDRSEEMLRALYKNAGAPIFAVNTNTAEFIKYLSNSVLATLISFANEMSMAADAFGNIQVAEAFRILLMDERWQGGGIGKYFWPGCGYGGYCLPKDTQALCAAAQAKGFDMKILKDVVATNNGMPAAAARRIMAAAGEDRRRRIGILGLAFKPGSDDVRDAASAKIIRALNDAGYLNITAYDPIAIDNFKNTYRLDCTYTQSMDQLIESADVLGVVTRWPEFERVRERTAKPVVDCVYMLG